MFVKNASIITVCVNYMIKGWNYVTFIHGGLSVLFLAIFFFGESNMFTLPIALIFVTSTAYCALQWHTMKLFKKIEAKHPKWK